MIDSSCVACLTLDAADGVVDGRIIPVTQRIQHPGRVMRALSGAQERFADAITAFAGSLAFVYLHTLWFGLWVLLNCGFFTRRWEFDRYPFGLLTMIVSLEAIFLSTFVMVSQNRQAQRTTVRAELDFEANLRSEVWAAHIGKALGLDEAHIEQVVTAALREAREG